MKTLINRVHDSIIQHNLIPSGSKIILGLSGGPDSIFLLHALLPLHRNKTATIIAAHLDHEWRKDSFKDVEFCKQLTNSLGIQLVTAKISELSLNVKYNGSQEDMGRRMRRHFFTTVRMQENANKVALAHHADDQQETFFIRLLRGTSLTGLTCMQPEQDGYIRPLLGISKKEILAYLDEHKIVYLTDPTNDSENYLRNRIRKRIIPELTAVDHRFEKNFEKTLNRLQETERFFDKLAKQTCDSIIASNNKSLSINPFLDLDIVMQHRVLIEWLCAHQVNFPVTEAFLYEIIRFFNNKKNNLHQIHENWIIEKKADKALIQANLLTGDAIKPCFKETA